MRWPITLKPAGSLPRSVELRFLTRPLERPAQQVVVPQEPVAPVPELPAGCDIWYETPTKANIPWAEYSHATLPDTQNFVGTAPFTVDDAVDFEGDYQATPSEASAWWQIDVPADAGPDPRITVDTWQTVMAPGFEDPSLPDTVLSVFYTDEVPAPDIYPTAGTDFSTLILLANSDDDPEPGADNAHLSKVEGVNLVPGRRHWIRVGIYGTIDPDAPATWKAIYKVRISLSFDGVPP